MKLKHGIWNTLDHIAIRAFDAATTFILVYLLAPELFSTLVYAQAIASPLLFLFFSLENVFYRDFALWKADGEISRKVRSLRRFGWLKFPISGVVSGIAAWIWHSLNPEISLLDQFLAIWWAFVLPLSHQFSGPDREFLRMELRLKELNLLTWFQKVTLFGFTALAGSFAAESIPAVFFAASGSGVLTAIICRFRTEKSFGSDSSPLWSESVELWRRVFQSFSMGNHSSIVFLNWFYTLDLFLLGFVATDPRTLGLYGIAIKVSNLAMLLPQALGNLFSVWLGRGESDLSWREIGDLKRYTQNLLTLGLLQALVLYFISPYLLGVLSAERWSLSEIEMMTNWLKYLLASMVFIGGTHLIFWWMPIRDNANSYFKKVHLPWIFVSFGLLLFYVQLGGVEVVPQAKLILAIGYFFMNLVYFLVRSRALASKLSEE